MAYCRDCSKLTGVEQGDPELTVDFKDESVVGSCRITLNCTECGSEVRHKEFDIDVSAADEIKAIDHDCPDAKTGIGWYLAEESAESRVRTHPPNKRRYTTFYGFDANFLISCNCEEAVTVEVSYSDDCKASEMEEI